MNIEVFQNELGNISNVVIRKFVSTVLKDINPELEEIPASTSGKHHPAECCEKGGLVKHIRRACSFAVFFMAANKMPEDSLKGDVIIAALLLHDIGKRANYAGAYWDYVNHPIKATELMKPHKHILVDHFKSENIYNAIHNCVLFHMGPWTPNSIQKPMDKYNHLELIVYYSDYLSSKKELDFVKPT